MQLRKGLLIAIVLASQLLTGCDRPADTARSDADSAIDLADSSSPRTSYMGREIAPVRGHEMAEWFDRPTREASELPDRLVRAIGIDSSDVVVDIGAGTGYFTFRLSEIVPRGRVIAVDIDRQMLDIIRARAESQNLDNIEVILGTPQDPMLPRQVADVVLVVDSYHEFSHPPEMLAGIYEGLTEGGRLVVVEYRAEDPTIPVESQHRMSEEQIRREVEASGFEWVETRDFLPQQHVVIFRRPIE